MMTHSTPSHVAVDVDGLSCAWLSAALDRNVSAVSVERIGTGQTAATYRLTIDSESLPRTLVAKVATGDAPSRRRVKGGYRSEVGFYQDLISTVTVRTSRCWYAGMSDDNSCFTLLLDDLDPLMPGVQIDGCTVARATDAVRNLAALHASRWSDESLFDLDFLNRPTEAGASFLGALTVTAADEFVRRFGADLGTDDIATLRESAAAIATWQMARTSPFALVHGDYRLDNLLFPRDGDGVVVIDWQTLGVAPAARDLAYFLGNSLHVEDRRANERQLVAVYHAALVDRGVEGYDFDHCFDDYRLGHLQGPMITMLGCTHATGERTPQSDAMFLAMATRSCAAIRDLGTLDQI